MKTFRLLLTCAAMFALVMPFTSCTDDKASDVKKPVISLTAAESGEASVSFVVSTSNTDNAYYWIYPAEEVVENWEIADGTSVECSKDQNVKEALVTVASLEPGKEYKVYAAAMNFVYTEMAEPIVVVPGERAVAPSLSVAVDETSIQATQFSAVITTANVESGAYLAVPKYTEVSAAKVWAEGTALAADQLNVECTVVVEGLTPNTVYDFYVVVAGGAVEKLSEVIAVALPEMPAPAIVEVYAQALNAAEIMTPSQHGIPGVYWLNVMDSMGYTEMVSLMFIDNQTGMDALSNGFFAVNSSAEYDPLSGVPSSEDMVLLSNPGYTCAYIGDGEYYVVAGQDPNQFGVMVQTLMPDDNNNYIQFYLQCKSSDDPAVTTPEYLLMGSFMGPFEGYSAGGGEVQQTERTLNYSTFKMTVEGNVVKVKFSDSSSDMALYFNTESGVLCPEVGAWYQYSIEQGTLSPDSYYWEPLDDWTFYMTEGGVRVKKESDTVYWFYIDGLKGTMTAPMQMVCTFTDSGAWKPTLSN